MSERRSVLRNPRLQEYRTTPVSREAVPGVPIPMEFSSSIVTFASLRAFQTVSAIESAISSAGRGRSVLQVALATIL